MTTPLPTVEEYVAGQAVGTKAFDLKGERLQGSRLYNKKGVYFENGVIEGEVRLIDCDGAALHNMTVDGGDSISQSLVMNLGSHDFTLSECIIKNGHTSGQIVIGLGQRGSRSNVPLRWSVDKCTVIDNGIWGESRQAHSFYALTDPQINMAGTVTDTLFSQKSGWGAPVKVGGTGNNPYVDGAAGITFKGCVIETAPAPDSVAQVVLTSGVLTRNIIFDSCFFNVVQGDFKPELQLSREIFEAMMEFRVHQGSNVLFQNCQLPSHAYQLVDIAKTRLWFWKYFETVKSPVARNVGGLRWLTSTLT